MKNKFILLFLIAGLITACGSQVTEAPAAIPTDEPATATEVPANTQPAADTPVPAETTAPTNETADTSSTVSFATQVFPILQNRCKVCHGGDRGVEEGLELISYASLMAGSDNGPVVIPGDAEGSLLVELLMNQEMPKRGPKLTPPQVQLIIDWVNQGALDN